MRQLRGASNAAGTGRYRPGRSLRFARSSCATTSESDVSGTIDRYSRPPRRDARFCREPRVRSCRCAGVESASTRATRSSPSKKAKRSSVAAACTNNPTTTGRKCAIPSGRMISGSGGWLAPAAARNARLACGRANHACQVRPYARSESSGRYLAHGAFLTRRFLDEL